MLKNCTTKCAVVAVVTLSVFGDRPSQKFLIWFAFLEVPDLGDILHTHQSIQKKKKKKKASGAFSKAGPGPCPHHTGCAHSVSAHAQTIF